MVYGLLATVTTVCFYAAEVHGVPSTVARGNVVFNHVKEVSISHTSWKLTYVIDLSVYDNLFATSFKHLEKVAAEVWVLKETNRNNESDIGFSFDPQYRALYRRLQRVNQTKDALLETLNEYKSLRPRVDRRRRSFLPFVGNLYSELFGVLTEDSMNDIRRSINDMSDNQQKIKHVVNQSLTIISTTNEHVRQNRQKINGIITQLDTLRGSMDDFTSQTNSLTKTIVKFLTYYSQLSVITDDMEELAVEAMRHLDDLKTILSHLSMNRLTPNVVGPLHLREILREINRKLPNNLFIPIQPKNQLWEFYNRITCSSAFDKNHVLIVLDVPLGSYKDSYDLIQVHNMPLPNVDMYKSLNHDSAVYKPRQMVAQYDLEVETFAIERARGSYILLTTEEAHECLHSKKGSFCDLRSPVYHVGPEPRACVVALYLNNRARAKQVCQVKVRPNHILPLAKNIDRGKWLISSIHTIAFTVTCRPKSDLKRGRTYTQKVRPPLHSLTLPPNCAANSEFITLPAYNNLNSVMQYTPNINTLFENATYELWKPLYDKLPRFNATWDLAPLENIDEIKIDDLVATLNSTKYVHLKLKDYGWGWKEWLIAAVLAIFGLLVLGYMFKKRNYGQKIAHLFASITPGRHPHTSAEAVPLELQEAKTSPSAPHQDLVYTPPSDSNLGTSLALRPGDKGDRLEYQSHPLQTEKDDVIVSEKEKVKTFALYPMAK